MCYRTLYIGTGEPSGEGAEISSAPNTNILTHRGWKGGRETLSRADWFNPADIQARGTKKGDYQLLVFPSFSPFAWAQHDLGRECSQL